MGLYFNPGGDISFNRNIAKRRIGRRLKALRKNKREILDDVANHLGISRSQVSKIENGKNELDASMMAILAEKYNTTVESFYNLKGYVVDYFIYKLLSSENIDSPDIENCMRYMDYRFNEINKLGRRKQLLEMLLLSFVLCEKYNNPKNRLKEADKITYNSDKLIYEANKWCRDNGFLG